MANNNTIGKGPSYKPPAGQTIADKATNTTSSSQVSPQHGIAGSSLSQSPTQMRNQEALAKWQERLSGLRTREGTRRLKVPKQVTKGRVSWAKIVVRVAKGLYAKTLEIKQSEDWIIAAANKARSNYELTAKGEEYKELTNEQKQDMKELHDVKMDVLKRKLYATQKGYEPLGNKAASLTTFNTYGHELGSRGWSVGAQVRKMDRTLGRLPEAVARHISDKLDAEDFKKAEIGTAYPGKDGKQLPLLSFPRGLGFTSSKSGFFKSTHLREQCRALVVSVLLTQGADKALEVKRALMAIATSKGSLDKVVEDFFGVLKDAETAQHLAGLAHMIIQAGKTVTAFIK